MRPPVTVRPLDPGDALDLAAARRILGDYLDTTAVEMLEARDEAAGSTRAEVDDFLRGIMPDVLDPVSAYAPDDCVLLIAESTSGPPGVVGCVGITPVDEAHTHPSATGSADLAVTCEMNRLYVAPSHRGGGVARALIDSSREWARSHGYRRMILDVVPYRTGAIALYRSMGFRDGAAVVDHPVCTVPLECDL